MSKQSLNKNAPQTRNGKYSPSLSNTIKHGVHKDFREEEPFFRQIIDSLEDYAVFTTDMEGHISSWNSGAENLLGYSEEEIIGQPVLCLFTPHDIKSKIPQKERTMAKKTGRASDERYHVRKDGSSFFVSGMMFALYDERGKIRGFTKLMRDISHRKVIEDIIKQGKAYAESIVDTAREPLIVLNKDFTVNSANRAFYKTFKITKKHSEGHSIYELCNGEWNIPAIKELLEDILPHNTSFNDVEIIHEFSKIGTRTMLLNARKLWRIGNHTEMILLAMEDITDRKNAEQFKNAFIGVASHEFKGPVGNIKGYTQLLQKRTAKSEDRYLQSTLEKINLQTDKLAGMVNHLLDISRIQSGKLQLDKVHFDLNDLTTGIIDDLQPGAKTHHIIQQGSISEHIYADKFRIAQVLTNLISNAIKYSPGADKVVVKLSQDKNKTHATVSIHDYGIGIPEDDRKGLFQAFSRAKDVLRKRIPGIGLGLHISSEIIKEHDGKIWFTSNLNEGSNFHFSLPIK